MTFHVNFVRQESTKSRVFFFHINSFLSGVTTLVNLEALERLIPCPSTGPKMFCAGPNFLSQSKTLIAFSASSKTFVPVQKLNGNYLLVWHKMFGNGLNCISIYDPAQKI